MKIRSAELATSVGLTWQIQNTGLPEIAFAGRSNVGKSSLLNRLLNRKNLARTSNTPGKTRTLNYYQINDAFYLVDLPGYGYAKRSKAERQEWGRLLDRYVENREPLRGFIQLIDARHDPTADDLNLVSWLCYAQKPFIVVATKTDKLSGSKLKPRLDKTQEILNDLGDIPLLSVSARTGRGRDALWIWIQEALYGSVSRQ
ncbi:MAG: ribosome biogenesis GTP-binding protein YihA/YsxC [bacterium]|nr:ribosome biogenesis GTP-binding protein YihA/YsxC [bacterium]